MQAFRGRRLREARLARGLYMNALGDLLGITGTAISRYEDDVDKPPQDRIAAIAKHLNFPIEFFLQPEWPERPQIVHWRSRSAETKYARDMTEQRMIWTCELFSYLERDVNFPALNLPNLKLPDFRALTPALIEAAAEAVRKHWKLRELPVPDACLALENAGIPVVNLDITSEKQDGFCFQSETLGRPFVGINSLHISSARARYDVAHELGHAVLHRAVTLQQLRDPSLNKQIEQQAHRFAGAFLFPREAFRFEVMHPTLDYFCALKKRWGMSIAAMIYRAFDLGMIDEQERSVLYRNLTRRGWRGPLQEPFDDPSDMAIERPRMIRRGVRVVLELGTSKAAIKAALNLPEKEIEQIAGLEPGFFRPAAEVHGLAIAKRPALKATDIESGEVIEFPQSRRR
ncbi:MULTISPECIES: ImmA/IrrE family metallo-endopeptidase [Bradyrhizobium]|uniref:ImmA/IrrE family metallo-endopeptidase n=1 Tax=Bradyrhizobium tropiciagri TaxID=312253 RepID=UPI0024BF840F|nr:XRE family transcriptional regulator [Bradyrhizobium tropiciagri]